MDNPDLTAVLATTASPSDWSKQREQAKRDGDVPIGGGRGDGMSLAAYYDATKTLFTGAANEGEWRLRQLARPVLYLQRHTVELALKQLIWDLRRIVAMSTDIEARRIVKEPEYPITHDLKALCDTVRAEFTPHEILAVPDALIAIAGELVTFEDGDPTRPRYDMGAPPRKAVPDERKTGRDRGVYAKSSFPRLVHAPITRWQRTLDELMSGPLGIREDFFAIPKDEWTVGERIGALLDLFQRRHEEAGLSTPEKLSYEVIALALEGIDDLPTSTDDRTED